jgi:hypothetical protein
LIVLAGLFLAAALLFPRSLNLLNRAWFRLGLVLNRIVSPIVIGTKSSTAAARIKKESRLMRNKNAKPRLSIRLAGILIIAVMLFAAAEIFSSLALIYSYRLNGTLKEDASLLSSVTLANKALVNLRLLAPSGRTDQRTVEQLPHGHGMFASDNVLGWSVVPGRYTMNLKHRVNSYSEWEVLPIKVTINDDRSRWTGVVSDPAKSNIYIFGDSDVFGWGVNDEQTFAYHLQMARPDYNVKLFAVAGYGLVHNYLHFLQMKETIRPNDIVIIGYADYYDLRNVAAPSRLREVDANLKSQFPGGIIGRPDKSTPRAELRDGDRLTVSLVEQECDVIIDYCRQPDPPQSYLTAVSARLITEMGRSAAVQTIVLHIDGSKSNPVFSALDKNIKHVSALQEDFGYFIRDSVLDFDTHPGPYWHYAISRKLLSVIQ